MNLKIIIKLANKHSKSKTKLAILALILIFAMGASSVLSTFAESTSDVTVSGQNLQRTYYSDGSAPYTSNLLWKFQMNAPPGEFACAVVNGVVYQGCLGTGDVYAINETTGSQIWHVALNNTANSITYYNGLIYTQGGSLPYDPIYRSFGDEWIALNAQTGAIVWIYKIPQNEWGALDVGTYGQPPIIVNGEMYVDVYNGIATLNASTGQEMDRWFVVPKSFYNAYVNGTIYGVELNQTDSKFYAFSGNPATKTLNWVSKDNPLSPFGYSDVGAGTFSGVAFSDDLFVSEYNFANNNATAINHIFRVRVSDGALAWVFPIIGYAGNGIAVAYNNVYAGTSAGNVYAVSKTEGTSAVWTQAIGSPIQTPLVVADSKVFLGSENSYIYALDAFNGSIIWSYHTGGAVIGSPVIANGKLFVASKDQYLYAFGAPTPKPASQLTLSIPTTAASGKAITVNGRLTDSSGAPVVSAIVTFQERIVPRTDYTNVTALTTNANGNFTYTWTPPIDGAYDLNVVYNGDGLSPSSALVTISVGSSETVVTAINNLQTLLIVILAVILVLAIIAVVLSALALGQARRKQSP